MKKRIGYTIPVILGILLTFIFMISGFERDRQKEGKQQLEEALRRAAVTCYAVEGFYPSDLEYIISQYGLQYDDSQYVVYYEVFASNLMPEITVLEK